MTDTTLQGSAHEALRKGSALLWVAFVLSFFVSLLHLAGPMFIILTYDRVLPSRSEETLLALFLMICVLILTLGVLDYARKRIVARYAAQFQERMEQTILKAAQQDAIFPEGRSKPVIGLDEADGLRGFFHSGGVIAIMDFIWVPLFVTVIFVLHPMLGYVCLGGILVMTLLVCVRLGFVGRREQRHAEASGRIAGLKKQVTASRDVLREQAMSVGFKEQWLRAREDGRDGAIALRDWTAWFDQMSSTTLLLVRYSILAMGAWLVLDGGLTVGAMVACVFLVTRVLLPVSRFASTVPSLFRAVETWRRLKRILAGWDEAATAPFPTDPPSDRVRLEIRGLSVKSPLSGTLAFKPVSLKVAPGTMVEVLGGTGQGKSALAEGILGLARRNSGAVLIDGTNTERMTDAELADAVGYVPENPRFVSGTIAQNIARLDPDATAERISAAARKACLHAWISALPLGYQTVLDPSGSMLPNGQRQQLSLARALYRTPKVLVIDQPDDALLERLPDTMKKTFDGFLDAGGVVLLLSRKALQLAHDRIQYQLDKGGLSAPKPIYHKGKAAMPKVTVLNDGSARKGRG